MADSAISGTEILPAKVMPVEDGLNLSLGIEGRSNCNSGTCVGPAQIRARRRWIEKGPGVESAVASFPLA
jgi:hypothetical protein